MPSEWLAVQAPFKPARAWLVSAGLLVGSLGLAWHVTRVSPDPAERLGWSIRFSPPQGWHRVSPLAGGEAIVAYGPGDDRDDDLTGLHARLFLQAIRVDRALDYNSVFREFLNNVVSHFSARDIRALPVQPCVVGAYDGREARIGTGQVLLVRVFFASAREGYVVAMVGAEQTLEATRVAFESLCDSVRPVASSDAPSARGTEESGH